MKTYYVTFGYGHHDKTHDDLTHCYVKLQAETIMAARIQMADRRGNKWCDCYNEDEAESLIAEYGLREVFFDNLTAQIGENQ